MMTVAIKLLAISLLALGTQGCANTYIPVSWGMPDKVKQLASTDQTLLALYNRYDPQRTTLRIDGKSFEEVMMPDQVKYHLGAYRQDAKLIYRSLYRDYTDDELRDLLVHELAHHVWFSGMSRQQRSQWREYLELNPSAWQPVVRANYSRPEEWEAEDFAFTIQFARPADIEELVKLEVIAPEESAKILVKLPEVRHGLQPPPQMATSATDDLSAGFDPTEGPPKKKR